MGNTIKGPRRHTLHTKLGRILAKRGVRVWEFAAKSGVHPRILTEYLSGRVQPTTANLDRMARCLHVRAEDLLEAKYPWEQSDQSSHLQSDHRQSSQSDHPPQRAKAHR